MIEATELTKRYGDHAAVDRLSFQIRPGRVTGFLGPNGAGKSTTMRLILGLASPTSGTVRVDGVRYGALPVPLRKVGSLLDARGVHGGRPAYAHLHGLAASNGIPRGRVAEVLDLVGLPVQTAKQRVRDYSLGMGQRLGIAAALLGDPEVLILDEPVNGLDTEGIRWVRDLLKSLAAEGRTVFLSSHLMSEMELTADHLVVIGQGRLLADMTMREFIKVNSHGHALLRTPEPERLRELVERAGGTWQLGPRGGWRVGGLDASRVGDLARDAHVALHELTPSHSSLEEIYTELAQPTSPYRAKPRTEREAA